VAYLDLVGELLIDTIGDDWFYAGTAGLAGSHPLIDMLAVIVCLDYWILEVTYYIFSFYLTTTLVYTTFEVGDTFLFNTSYGGLVGGLLYTWTFYPVA
jgi:hypothetical protein